MRMLFSSSRIDQVAGVKNLLTRANIPCQIINDAMSPAMVEMALYPELWIEQDEDFLAASVLLASWRRNLPAPMITKTTPTPKVLELCAL